jgi:predicted amidohydrolase YtcJ
VARSGLGHARDKDPDFMQTRTDPEAGRRSVVRAVLAAALAAAVLSTTAAAAPAPSRAPDLVIVHGKIATLDARSTMAQALAVKNGKIVAVGTDAAIRALARPATRVIDAQGRTVVPGLIDSHIHAVRAGLSFSTEVSWIDVDTIGGALDRLRRKAAASPPGTWLIVAGGWSAEQFAERRRPTLQEIEAAAPAHPVYIQLGYGAVLLNARGGAALNLAPGAAPPEMTADPASPGWFRSDNASTTALFDRLPKPSPEQQLEGTRRFYSELNRLAITGVSDPGGFSVSAPSYEPTRKLWRDGALTVRVAYSVFAQNGAREFEEFQTVAGGLSMGAGDDMFKFNGLGERVLISLYNNTNPDEAVKEKLREILLWAARKRFAVTIHWSDGPSASRLLEVFDAVDRQASIRDLRWSIAHLDDADAEVFRHMARLGVGWTMQDAMYFAGDARSARDPEAVRRMPAIMTAIRSGVHVGAGTDAHRVASYNPFVNLRWMLDGLTIGGRPTRGPDEIPTREQALRLYTIGSAWFSFDEAKRGTLESGKYADLAILDRDYFTVPVAEIGRTSSLLTLVGGRVVHAAAPYGAR